MTDVLFEYLQYGKTELPEQVVNELTQISQSEICNCISRMECPNVNSHNIPQYSNYDNGTYEMLKYLRMSGDFGPSFTEIGEHFLERGHKPVAYIKYGENHSKLAELLGLVEIKKTDRKRVYLSEVGKRIEKLEKKQQFDCFTKLAARVPIVQEAVKRGISSPKELEVLLNDYLSAVTALRRRRNTWILVERLQGKEQDGV